MDNKTSIIIFHRFRKIEECLSMLNKDMEDIKKNDPNSRDADYNA